MKRKTLYILLLPAILFILDLLPIAAQTELDATFVAEDSTFKINYPSSWRGDASDPAFVTLSGFASGYQMSITAFSTQLVISYAVGASSAFDVAQNLAAEPNIEADAAPLLIGRRDAAVASITIDNLDGVVFVIEMENGTYGMVIVVGSKSALEVNRELVLKMIESYDAPNFIIRGAELTNYADDWEAAIAELQDLGLVAQEGGSLVFEEDRAFFNGQGFVFTPLGRRAPHTDIVMAAEIEFTSDSASEYEDCSLLARVVGGSSETVSTYLQVGLDNSSDIFYYDSEGTEETTIYQRLPLRLDLSVAHHLLFIVADEFLTVYIDGERVFDQVEINVEREGTYGIALLGRDSDSRCEGRNIWVYEFTSERLEACIASANGTINKRTGPGTNFNRSRYIRG
ncbi:MAG: hypothetical protein Q9P01_04545 [Anaerolineae bacterium]|nr:hypothetical protein [Anaerolineae bacterium]